MLTPGLTRYQAASLDNYLERLSGVPWLAAVALYQDADQVAARILTPHGPTREITPALDTIDALLERHDHPLELVGYVAGFAFGVRLGQQFIRPPKPRSKWISAEYKALSEASRKEVGKLIRLLLKAQDPPLPTSKWSNADSRASAQRWKQAAGKQARVIGGER